MSKIKLITFASNTKSLGNFAAHIANLAAQQCAVTHPLRTTGLEVSVEWDMAPQLYLGHESVHARSYLKPFHSCLTNIAFSHIRCLENVSWYLSRLTHFAGMSCTIHDRTLLRGGVGMAAVLVPR